MAEGEKSETRIIDCFTLLLFDACCFDPEIGYCISLMDSCGEEEGLLNLNLVASVVFARRRRPREMERFHFADENFRPRGIGILPEPALFAADAAPITMGRCLRKQQMLCYIARR